MSESQDASDSTSPILPLREALRTHESQTHLAHLAEIRYGPTSIYTMYGRDYKKYRYHFGNLLPDAASLPKNALMVDLMGPGELYRSLQRNNLQVSGIALTLTDKRDIQAHLFDIVHSNSFVTGDILNKHTWQRLERVVGGRPINLIVCGPGGGAESIPKSTRVYAGLLERAYRMLGPGGRLVTDVPAEFEPYFDQLEKSCRRHNILFEEKRIPSHSKAWYGSMMVQKTEGSPETIMNIFTDIPHL